MISSAGTTMKPPPIPNTPPAKPASNPAPSNPIAGISQSIEDKSTTITPILVITNSGTSKRRRRSAETERRPVAVESESHVDAAVEVASVDAEGRNRRQNLRRLKVGRGGER